MKMYILGPMTDIKDYEQNFDKAEHEIREEGCDTVYNPCWLGTFLKDLAGFGYKDILLTDLMILSRCDAIVMLKGWQKSFGARTEFKMAYEQDKKIYFETDCGYEHDEMNLRSACYYQMLFSNTESLKDGRKVF